MRTYTARHANNNVSFGGTPKVRKALVLGASLVAAALGLGVTAPASAQLDPDVGPQIDSEIEVETREEALRRLEALELGARAAVAAERYRRIPGGPVTFAEVLRDPDDLALNFRYAQTQIADGNLKGAAATLERMLLIAPGAAPVRLLYAFVLYRLDNLLEARAQLEALAGVELTAAERAELDELEARLARRTRRTVWHATVLAGVTFQSNANFAPESEQVDVIVGLNGLRLALRDVPVEGPEDDAGYVAGAVIGFVHDLGHQARHELFGSASVLHNEQVAVDETDYTDYSINAGGIYRAPWGDVTGQLLAGHFSLDDDSLLTDFGAELALERRFLDDRLGAFVRQRSTYEDYDSADGVTPERTGPRYELELGAGYRLSAGQRLGASLEYTVKEAREEWREFERFEAGARHVWLLGRGRYVQNRLAWSREVYDAPNPRVALRRRADEELVYRLTLSSPLGALARGLPRALRDVRVSASAQYQRADSNIQNFEFENASGQLLFSKRFDF